MKVVTADERVWQLEADLDIYKERCASLGARVGDLQEVIRKQGEFIQHIKAEIRDFLGG